MLQYYVGDELGDWEVTHKRSGQYPDYSTGHTFTVIVYNPTGSTFLTKTTGITGATGGVVTVAWAAGELPTTPGQYPVRLIIRRTSGSKDQTIADTIEVLQ